MAREDNTARGHGDGKADPLHQEREASEEEETIENVEKEVKREVSVRVRDCRSLLKPATRARKVVVGIPKKVPGINCLTKTPRKIKASKREMRHRHENHENPTPKLRLW